jgi:hypothetical protein
MARPLRIEFAGALYHVTSRGDGQEAIYMDDKTERFILSSLLLSNIALTGRFIPVV